MAWAVGLGGSSNKGALRSAIEGLLRACVDLDRQAVEMSREAGEQARQVARSLAGLRDLQGVPGLAGLADEIAGVGTQMEADVSRILAEGRRPYVVEIHQLLALLAPLHDQPPLLPLPVSVPAAVPGAENIAAQFPSGFAQTYVRDLLRDIEPSTTVDRDTAAAIPVPLQGDADTVTHATRAGFDAEDADIGVALLQAETSHTTERHGSHIAAEAQLVRLIWLKDPAGQDIWKIQPDGTVKSKHSCGIAAGGFTSPEALAKPLAAILRAARERAGGLQQFLNKNTYKDAVLIGIHVSVESAGLVAGDASGYRGAGTGTPETRRDWGAARRYSLKVGRATVYGVPSDPLAEGDDPGATVVFVRADEADDWHLLTCYPMPEQDPRNKRLEDMR